MTEAIYEALDQIGELSRTLTRVLRDNDAMRHEIEGLRARLAEVSSGSRPDPPSIGSILPNLPKPTTMQPNDRIELDTANIGRGVHPPDHPLVRSVTTNGERITHINGDELRPLLHVHGAKPCHRPAMYLTRLIHRGERPDLTVLRLLPDMRIPTPVDAPVCGSCGLPIDPYTNQDLDWRPHFTSASQQTFVRPLRLVPVDSPGQLEPEPDTRRGSGSDRLAPATPSDNVRPLPERPLAEESPTSTTADLDGMTELADTLWNRTPESGEREV